MEDCRIEDGFPTLITVNKNLNSHDWKQRLAIYKAQFKQQLLKRGALVFRDFSIDSTENFSDFIKTMDLGSFVNYIGGDSPRDKVTNEIYTSTEAPPSIYIPPHQELSYLKTYPKYISFYCEIEPQIQGETVIADARKVYQRLDSNVIKHFQEKGLTYISHYYQQSKFMDVINYFANSHKSWVDVFETDKKEEVEAFCQSNEIRWKWLRSNWIEIRHTRPATLEHPITKETVWFNQAHLYDFNPRLLGLVNFLAMKFIYFRRLTRLHEVTFADGSIIPREDLYHILDVLRKNTVSLPWKKGDVMILDNILTMHGRATFKGKRRILTALIS
ncbi:pyoverdine biosynthesis regulatory gene SyrP-like protein [Legionella lansingensis]|uniref:TauD/TfdA-like domain-containing protein n=2 Tax=Legionella lansingensis TaxID=45067 RepID=A0A0W0VW39_9GAMM|nr:TauD/TfdA family dioxygenase [Legionella lansingensis]KTD24291.1 hypothetical protein Llan_0430 [Legionella lansingensis]SNV51885.1 pyoverdine biosynthesis regulatory gene SyrP-like protein [Legionella lansingensis]